VPPRTCVAVGICVAIRVRWPIRAIHARARRPLLAYLGGVDDVVDTYCVVAVTREQPVTVFVGTSTSTAPTPAMAVSIQRHIDVADSRRSRITLTSKGAQTIAAIAARVRPGLAARLNGLAAKEVGQLLDTLERL
jgi:hypothetical protein